MLLKVLILLSINLYFDVVCSPHLEFQEYMTNVYNQNKNLVKDQLFCYRSSKEVLAAYCKSAKNAIQTENSEYYDIELNYKSFTVYDSDADKCHKDEFVYFFENKVSEVIPQMMVTCYCRSTIVEKDMPIENGEFYEAIKFYVYDSSVVVFSYQKTIMKYVFSKWLTYVRIFTAHIQHKLFSLEPPNKMINVLEVHRQLNQNKDILTNRQRYNILNPIEKNTFKKLCIMALKSRYPQFVFDPKAYYGRTTYMWEQEIILEQDVENISTRIRFTVDVYQCRGNILKKTGYSADRELYAITPGINQKSIVLLMKAVDFDGRYRYTPIELIDNLQDEFLNLIVI